MEFNVNNSFFTGKFLLHLPSVDSTNTYAKALISKSSPIDGTVILADEQFAGRGQAGTQWASEPNKNLTFSLIYHTGFLPATEQFYLSMAVASGLRDAVQELLDGQGIQQALVHIKWPNDILVEGKKIAGILLENTISGMYLNYSVIGIGLNVNQTDFPEGIVAVGLKRKDGPDLDLNKVLNALLVSIERHFLQLKERKYEKLRTEYLQHLYRLGEESRFGSDSDVFYGKIIGVDPSGKLRIETQQGTRSFGFKEIRFL